MGLTEVRYALMYRSYWSGIRVRLVGLVYADVVAARNVEKCDMQNTRACARLRSRDVLIYSRRCVVSASNSTSKTRCNPPPENVACRIYDNWTSRTTILPLEIWALEQGLRAFEDNLIPQRM